MAKPEQTAKVTAEADNEVSSAGAKVTVACKLPHGLIIRIFEKRSERELVMGGGSREVDVYRPTGDSFRVNGNATPVGIAPTWPIVGGYGLTHGISKDAWEAWLADNKTSALVRNGLIFAYEKGGMAEDRAKEQSSVRSGLEPMDPEGDLRAARSPNKNLADIKEEEQRAKARAA